MATGNVLQSAGSFLWVPDFFFSLQLVLAGESKKISTQLCKQLKDALEPIVDTYEMECYSALSTPTCICFSKPLRRPVVLNGESQSEKNIHCRAPQLTAFSHRPIAHSFKAPLREGPCGRCLNIVPAVGRGCFHLEKMPTINITSSFQEWSVSKKNANFTYLTWFHRLIKCHQEAKIMQGEYRYFTVQILNKVPSSLPGFKT